MSATPEVIAECLNGPREYDHYAPNDPPLTLEQLQEFAHGFLLNGPSGNIFVLRLLEIIKAAGLR